MASNFGSFCDDFYLDMCVNTQLELPEHRETILTFFEQLRKRFPPLAGFSCRQGEYLLEEERQGQRYRWVSLEKNRICAGVAAPEDMNEAYTLQNEVLELMPYMLGVSVLDIDSLDVTFTMDFDYQGNQDEIIAEAVMNGSSFGALFELSGAKTVSCAPSVVVALSEDCRTQARIAIESRTSVYDLRNEKFKPDEPISLYFTIRRYPAPEPKFDPVESFRQQCQIAEQMMFDKIIPCFARPLLSAIAQRH